MSVDWGRPEPAFPRQVLDRHTIEIGGDHLLRASLLPGREPTLDQPRHWAHASIGLSDMRPDCQQNVVDKQPVSLVGMAEGGQSSRLPRLEIVASLTA